MMPVAQLASDEDGFRRAASVPELGRPIDPPERARIVAAAAERNPGYDPDKLGRMLAWDLAQYNRPQLPAAVGTITDRAAFSRQRGLRLLDMAIRMPGSGWAVPQSLAQFAEVIRLAVDFERAINAD